MHDKKLKLNALNQLLSNNNSYIYNANFCSYWFRTTKCFSLIDFFKHELNECQKE